MTLALVHSRHVPCWPWHLRFLGGEPYRAAFCRDCRREIACPVENERDTPVCLYCAMAAGLIAAEDAPLQFGAQPS